MNQERVLVMILVQCPNSTHGEIEAQRKEKKLPTAVSVLVFLFHHLVILG